MRVIIDEANSLGYMQIVEDMLQLGRGYNVNLCMVYQSRGNLLKNWPHDGGQVLDSNTSQIYFAVNDIQTAEAVSKRLGKETAVVASGGYNQGQTWTGQPSGSNFSTGRNEGWSLQAREVMTPDEILALDPRVAITFQPGVRPVATCLLRYFEEKKLFRLGWFREKRERAYVMAMSGAFLLNSAVVAGLMTFVLRKAMQ